MFERFFKGIVSFSFFKYKLLFFKLVFENRGLGVVFRSHHPAKEWPETSRMQIALFFQFDTSNYCVIIKTVTPRC